MADVQYKLNFPIVTPEAYAFWESRHRLNRIKAIMAFSLDKDNANDNLRRAGYYRQYRKRYLELYDCIIAQPDMQNIPLSDLTEHWWDPIAICPLVPAGPVALGIKTNPVDVTALEGTTATFSVEAKGGTAPYTYQWEYSLMLANWVNASGGTSQTYSPTVETNTDGLHYRCVIKDAAGATVTSGYGKLTMIPKLAWNAHPATGTIGTDLDFSWTGGIAPFTVVVLNPAGTEHDRATHTSPYTLKTTNQADGEWTVTVEDSSVTKQTVTQKVQMAAAALPDATVPTISTQPTGQAVWEGDDATFTIVATNATEYKWQVQETNNGPWVDVPGGTSATLVLTKPANTQTGDKYHCIVTNHPANTNAKSVTSNAATLTMVPATAKPMWINDSHQAAPWIPLHVSDTEWKLDNATVSGSERYFAVWMADPSQLDRDVASPTTITGAHVTTFTSSDPSIVTTFNFTPGGRGTHFKVLATGQATLTATTDKGETIKLYIGVGAPAVTP